MCVLSVAIILQRAQNLRDTYCFFLWFDIIIFNVMYNYYCSLLFSAGTSLAVSSTLLALVLIGRASFVFPVANITNLMKKRGNTKIEFRQQVITAGTQHLAMLVKSSSNSANILKYQFIIWWAGLLRGAVTIALSYNQVNHSDFKSTLFYSIFSFTDIDLFNYMQFASSDNRSMQDSALMITCTIIVVLFSTVVRYLLFLISLLLS